MSPLENMLVLSCFFSIPAVCYFLLFCSRIRPLDVHPMSIFVGFYFLFSYAGLPVLLFHLDSYRIAMGVTEIETLLKLWYVSSGSLLLSTFAFFILSMTVKTTEISAPVISVKSSLLFKAFLFFMAIFCITSLAAYLTQIDAIPIFRLFSASSSELARFRSDSTSAFSGKYHWYRLFFRTIPLFLSYYLTADYLTAKSMKKFFLCFLSISFVAFSSVMNLEKAPIIWYILGLFLVYALSRRLKICCRHIIAVSAAVTSILVPAYALFMGASNPLWSIFSRATTGQLAPGYFYLEMFPDQQEFLLGASLPNPGGLFPWNPYRLTVEVMNYIFPDLAEKGIVGSAPAAFWGESYANFGFGGVLVGALFVGCLFWYISYLFHKEKVLDPLNIAAVVWFSMELQKLAVTGLSSVILNLNIYIMLFLFFFLKKIKYSSEYRNFLLGEKPSFQIANETKTKHRPSVWGKASPF